MFNSQLAMAGLISIPLTLAILLVVFGSLVGASIPLLLALTSVFATMGLIALPSQIVPMDESISEVILLIGLAVGVDYSLFYIRRERDERRAGTQRVGRTRGCSRDLRPGSPHLGHHRDDRDGRDVLLRRQDVHVVRDRDDDGRRRRDDRLADRPAGDAGVARRPRREGARPVPLAASGATDGESRVWGWILDRVLRRPLVSAAAAAAVLVVLALPAFNLHTAISGLDALPKSLKETQSYNRVNDAFPGGATPAVVAIAGDASDPELRAAVADLAGRGRSRPGKALEPITVDVAPGGEADAGRDPARRQGNRQARRTTRSRPCETRSCRRPSAPSTGSSTRVTGDTAASKDWNDAMRSAVPVVFAFVLAFAFLLLLVSFRSVVIPLKAILMNLLSVAAAYGVIVAVFQWGWGENLLDFNSNGGVAVVAARCSCS